jgi:hypothetical protein
VTFGLFFGDFWPFSFGEKSGGKDKAQGALQDGL